MTHEPRRDELLDLALGLLEPEQARALEAHAAGCAACRAELAALRQTRQLLADLPPVEAPGRGAAVVLAAARQAAEAAGAARPPRWAAPRWLWGGALGLAGAAALAVLVVRVSGPPERGPLSDDREALLGRAAPRPVPPPEAVTPAPVATAEAPRPRREPPAEPSAPAERARKAIGVGGAESDATVAAAPAPAAMAPRAGPAAEAKAEAMQAGGPAPSAPRLAARAAGEAPCRLERLRRVTRDAAGKVVGRVREGRYPAADGEVSLIVEERYGPDGRLRGATVRAGDRLITVSDADVAAGRLEPLPGVVLAATATEAVAAPPRCEP